MLHLQCSICWISCDEQSGYRSRTRGFIRWTNTKKQEGAWQWLTHPYIALASTLIFASVSIKIAKDSSCCCTRTRTARIAATSLRTPQDTTVGLADAGWCELVLKTKVLHVIYICCELCRRHRWHKLSTSPSPLSAVLNLSQAFTA